MIRNNICINCEPRGCEAALRQQIAYAKKTFAPEERGRGPRLALVVGGSTGYGLASRVCAAFGYGAATVSLSFEKAPSGTKCGTPGCYNNRAFDAAAAAEGLAAITLDGDAFSDEAKALAAEALQEAAAKAGVPPVVDLFVYSLASPVRRDPETGVLYRSVIKPTGARFEGRTVDMMTGRISRAGVEPATEAELADTVKVMGGADWERWMAELARRGLLSPATRALAYTYIGPALSWGIYRDGTIGRAKADLERACAAINETYRGRIAGAWVSVNKAVVTRASAVIPIIPLYVSCLFKVMKARRLHEDCTAQIARLYRERLYTKEAALDAANIATDAEGRIRLDDWEMREDVQKETLALMEAATDDNVFEKTDLAGFRQAFLEAHGFGVEGVDYREADEAL
jgi:enoyl-[acyl-carrier protein] reductase/trans-2-enoyl-CoA reductase (NAD+)